MYSVLLFFLAQSLAETKKVINLKIVSQCLSIFLNYINIHIYLRTIVTSARI